MARRTWRPIPNEPPPPLTEPELAALLAAVDRGELDPEND